MIHRISTHTLEAFQKADVDTLSPLLGQIYSYFSWKIAIMFAHAAVLVPATCVRKIDVPDSDKSILFACTHCRLVLWEGKRTTLVAVHPESHDSSCCMLMELLQCSLRRHPKGLTDSI